MTVVVVATIHPLPEHRAAVVAAFEETIARVHAEDRGCRLYALHDGDDSLVMIEKWDSAEDLKAHGTSPAMQELRPKLEGTLASPTDVQVFEPHPAGTAEQGTL